MIQNLGTMIVLKDLEIQFKGNNVYECLSYATRFVNIANFVSQQPCKLVIIIFLDIDYSHLSIEMKKTMDK